MGSHKPILRDDRGRAIFKWRIRIRSEEPTLIEFSDEQFGYEAPMKEMGKLVWRTSYMTGAPNREVWWAMDLWLPQHQAWECVINGKSTLRASAGPSPGVSRAWFEGNR